MRTMDQTETSTTLRVGTTASDEYIVVRMTLVPQDGIGKRTVDHDGAPDTFLRFTASGELRSKYAGRHTDPRACGQILDQLLDITKPAPGWTLEEIAELHALWTAWHLNDMRADCAHMTLPVDTSYDARKHVFCEQGTGYKYGSAWLVELLPTDVEARIHRLMRDRSADLYAARGYDASGKAL